MEWLNLKVSTLRAPEYIGCEPAARAAWLNVLAYAIGQECSGRIMGAAAWKDRQWQQTCGVTLQEVQQASPLLRMDGQDLIVWAYPISKEIEVKAKREGGSKGGSAATPDKVSAAQSNGKKGGRPKTTQGVTEVETQAEPKLIQSLNPTEGEGEGEGEGNRKKKGKGNGIGSGSNGAGATVPDSLSSLPRFLEEWDHFRDHRKQKKQPMTDHAANLILGTLLQRPQSAIAALQVAMVRGWTAIEWSWYDNHAGNGQKPNDKNNTQDHARPHEKYGW